jgi:drug/metabolite transporter (DMT)-like permease
MGTPPQPLNRMFWIVMVLIGASSYGILSPVIKLAYADGLNEVQVTVSQLILGTALLWIVVMFRPKAWMNPFRGPWVKLSFIGIFGLSLTTIFINSSLMTLSASLTMVLLFQFTWITIVMESILERKWPTRSQYISAGIIIGGTLLAVGLSVDDFKELSLKGLIFGISSAFTYSIFLTFTGRVTTQMDAVLRSAVMMTASLPIAVPLIFIMFPQELFFQTDIGPILYWGVILGLLGPVIPTILFNLGIPKIGSSLAAMLSSVELPVAIIGAFFILQEWVSLLQWLGVAMIIVGIVIAEKKGNAGGG